MTDLQWIETEMFQRIAKHSLKLERIKTRKKDYGLITFLYFVVLYYEMLKWIDRIQYFLKKM